MTSRNDDTTDGPYLAYRSSRLQLEIYNSSISTRGGIVEGIEITFLNWRKWQGRGTEFEETKWFRLSNRLCYHDLWDRLSPAQFKCFTLFLMLASQKSPTSGQFRIEFRTLLRRFGIKKSTVDTSCIILRDLGILEYQELTEGKVTCTSPRLDQIRIEEIRSEKISEDSVEQLSPPKRVEPSYSAIRLKSSLVDNGVEGDSEREVLLRTMAVSKSRNPELWGVKK